jgi:DNA primase/predicted transcriptional regulator
MATPEDRILLLLAIKEKGKRINFEHIAEKVIRDEQGKISEKEVKETLEELLKKQMVSEKNRMYAITEKGRATILEKLKDIENELNLSYRRVLVAKDYYPSVAEAMVPYLKERATSTVKVFSDEKDPFNNLKPLFVRYSRYKPKKTPIIIETVDELLRYVNAHAIDFIPYVHKLNSSEPDWLILDLDAGLEFRRHEKGFDLVKLAAKKVIEVLEYHEITPCIKFSGSRGIQIWAALDNGKLPPGDKFAQYRNLAIVIQRMTEQAIQDSDVADEFYQITKKNKPITTSTVAKKEERADQILIDWSSMKPNGDVRAPFSIHYKTGLVSCPISKHHLIDFKISEAEPKTVAENINKLRKDFEIVKSDPSLLCRASRFATLE